MNLDTKDTKSKKQKEKRCPNGTRKNPKTGLCEPINDNTQRITKKNKKQIVK